MDDKTYRRITTETKAERINRLNGHIVSMCVACGAGFTSKRNARGHYCKNPPRWRISYMRTSKSSRYPPQPGNYDCHAPNEATAKDYFQGRHYNRNCSYKILSIVRLDTPPPAAGQPNA